MHVGFWQAETARECVKNVVLVMNAAAVFDISVNRTASELWELAWAVIDPFYPALRSEIFGPDVQLFKKPT